ncbi:isoleucine--tRNA ligase [Chloroflexi bacterium TSY]|nr:isoleucine--tRNA ligase [Chloroflexi bacterium TSY]
MKQKNKFSDVSPSVNYPEMEEKVLEMWREKNVLRRSMEERKDGPRYVFFEGPPTANGRPGIHHVLARAFKDMFPRYKTMQGFYCLRKGGWDTHGLPVEIEVEKQLGITGKEQIEAYGLEAFNQHCKDSVFTYVDEWERLTERMAFWVDLDDAYVTMESNYVESVWWILKQFWEKELLYQGYKVVPYCPRCGTPLSSHELSLGYKEGTKDPSVFVKFKVRDQENTYFLAWTTTPWTLPGNAALGVGEKISYVKVRDESGALLYLASELAEKVLRPDYEVLEILTGKDLVGMHYEPLYTFLEVDKEYAYVVAADFVSTADGTGIVHMAPAFGADDMEVGRQYDLPVIMTIKPDGTFRDEVTWAGTFVKDADPQIEEELASRNLLYKSETYEHTYPFCWRCETPLLYYAKETWYVRTSQYRDQLVANNQQINWVPDHVKSGRFGKWLENNIDWALGRERFWGTPLPVWKSDAPGSTYMECIASREELAERMGIDVSKVDLHRPFVDDLTWDAPDGGVMRRVPEVIDVWFDSGAMPIAQWHYPFENQEMWEEQQQADYICEAVDQTRGWFYSLHAISTLLHDRPAYKNVICLGHILAEDGSKMSKSKGNVVDPWEAFSTHGADATRWNMYTASPPGNSRRFSMNLVAETVRKFMNTLWNTYSFFVTYANLSEGWTPSSNEAEQSDHLLDRWMLSELNMLVRNVTEAYETYDVLGATRPVATFVDDVSNWYVRLSRRRFWESDPAALNTLYQVLVTLSKLLAPATPFVADEIYVNLVRNLDETEPDSVHLSRWPEASEVRMDEQLSADMAVVQKVTSLGHAARQAGNLKVRQPLARVVVRTRQPEEQTSLERLQTLVLDELNVKELMFADGTSNLVDVEVFPFPKQLGQKYGRGYPVIRKLMGSMDQLELAGRFQAGETVELNAEGETYTIEPDDVEVRSTPREGFSVAQDGGYLVAVTTQLTPELESEGHARELVRRIQQLRKDAGLEISDRIALSVSDTALVNEVLAGFGDYVQEETLATSLEVNGATPAGVEQVSFKLGEDEITVGLQKA